MLTVFLDTYRLCIPGKKPTFQGGPNRWCSVCGCMSRPKFDPEAPCLFLKQSPCCLPEELMLEADSVQREKKESLAAVSVPRWSNCVIGAWSIESKLMNSAYFTMMIINPIVAVYILALDNIIWYDYVYMIYVCLARRICRMLDSRNRTPHGCCWGSQNLASMLFVAFKLTSHDHDVHDVLYMLIV